MFLILTRVIAINFESEIKKKTKTLELSNVKIFAPQAHQNPRHLLQNKFLVQQPPLYLMVTVTEIADFSQAPG